LELLIVLETRLELLLTVGEGGHHPLISDRAAVLALPAFDIALPDPAGEPGMPETNGNA
jgi:hypothetical protein